MGGGEEEDEEGEEQVGGGAMPQEESRPDGEPAGRGQPVGGQEEGLAGADPAAAGGEGPPPPRRPAQGSSRRQPCRRPLAGVSKERTGARCCRSLEVRTQEDIWYLCDVQPPVDTSELEFKWKIMTPSPYVDYYFI